MGVLEVDRPPVEPGLRVADVAAVISPLLAGERGARRALLAHPERGGDAERHGEDRKDAREERDADLDPAGTFSSRLTSCVVGGRSETNPQGPGPVLRRRGPITSFRATHGRAAG